MTRYRFFLGGLVFAAVFAAWVAIDTARGLRPSWFVAVRT